MGYVLLMLMVSMFWGVLFATLYIYLKTQPYTKSLTLPYPSCIDGRCVPATLQNLFNDEEFFGKFPAAPLGYDMFDAGRWLDEYSEGAFRLPTIIKQQIVTSRAFMLAEIPQTLLQQFHNQPSLKTTPNKYAALVLSVKRGAKKHCVGAIWDVDEGGCWVIDPATKHIQKETLRGLFECYTVEEVGMMMMGVNVVVLFSKENFPHIIKPTKPAP